MCPSKERYLRVLRLFNSKVDRLVRSLFVQYINRTGKFSIKVVAERGKPVKVEGQLPNEHEVGEFVLTFRFFIQDNEKCSLRNMRNMYKTMPVSSELRADFAKMTEDLNVILDSKPKGLELNINNESITNRKIMEVFVYGELAHADEEKAKIFADWKQIPLMFPLLEFKFSSILELILRALRYARKVNEKAIAELSQ